MGVSVGVGEVGSLGVTDGVGGSVGPVEIVGVWVVPVGVGPVGFVVSPPSHSGQISLGGGGCLH